MAEIIVTFQTEDGKAEKTLKDILLDSQLDESRQAVQMLLGLPENTPYRFVLERTGKILSDNLTFREAGVKQGDKIVLVSSALSANNSSSHSGSFYRVQPETSTTTKPRSLITYKLQLTIISVGQQAETYDYPIELTENYEDDPQRFFSEFNARERKNFVTALQQIVSRELKTYEIDKILRDWCDDISLGYRTTSIKI